VDKSCSSFQVLPGLVLTAAHCLSNYNFKNKTLEVVETSKIKLFCQAQIVQSEPTTSINHIAHSQLTITEIVVNKDFKGLPREDMAFITTSDQVAGGHFWKWAKTTEEAIELLKLNDCRTAGYSRGYYAEIPFESSGFEYDEENKLLKINGNDDFGDSGGPIICRDKSKTDYIVGMIQSIIGHTLLSSVSVWMGTVIKKD
jgi:hypothetical protein